MAVWCLTPDGQRPRLQPAIQGDLHCLAMTLGSPFARCRIPLSSNGFDAARLRGSCCAATHFGHIQPALRADIAEQRGPACRTPLLP